MSRRGGNIPSIGGPPQQQRQLNVDPSTLPHIECESCGSEAFVSAVVLKRISAIQSPDGKEGVLPVQTFACASCGSINSEFNPTNEVHTDE